MPFLEVDTSEQYDAGMYMYRHSEDSPQYYTPAHPDFRPNFSPNEMMRMGVFGDAYFGDELGQERRKLLPSEMFVGVKIREKPSWVSNAYGRKAGMSREWWFERRLIADCDPLGWFEWYCQFFNGRRIPKEDRRQIVRWDNFRKRHGQMLLTKPDSLGQKQALLQWAIDPERILKEGNV